MQTNGYRSEWRLFGKTPFLPTYWWDVGAIVLILLATIVINSRMIRHGLNGLGDLRWHITWIQHFSEQIREGIFYPRWLAGTNFGYGSPTFVFYPPLVYYIASFFKLIGLNSEQAISTVFSLGIFLIGSAFYLYGRSQWHPLAAFGGAVFYMTSPFVFGLLNGGGLASLFALIWIPIGLFVIDRAIQQPQWRIILACFWMLVALTHTPSLLIYAIAGGLYTLSLWRRHSFRQVFVTLTFMALGLAMAAFYLLPAVLEQPFTNINYVFAFLGDYINLLDLLTQNFRNQLFLQLFCLFTLALIAYLSQRPSAAQKRNIIYAVAVMLVVLFLVSPGSNWIWQSISPLQKLETPYRILSLLFFAGAYLCSVAIDGLLRGGYFWKFLGLTLITLIILFNLRSGFKDTYAYPTLHSGGKGKVFIRPWIETILNDPFQDKLIDVPEYRPFLPVSGNYPDFVRERYSDSGLPLTFTANTPLPVPQIGEPRFSLVSGQGQVKVEHWGSYHRKLKVEVQEPAILRVRLYYYPAWQLTVNGQPQPLEMGKDGTILVKLAQGSYILELSYGWTNALIAGTATALCAFLTLLGYGVFLWRKGLLFRTTP